MCVLAEMIKLNMNWNGWKGYVNVIRRKGGVVVELIKMDDGLELNLGVISNNSKHDQHK